MSSAFYPRDDKEFQDDNARLNKLLERRHNYFLLEGIKRKLYQAEFEKIQAEIISLKLRLNIYHDELDIFSVWIDYKDPDRKEKYIILENAELSKEVKWISKKYSPSEGKSEYIGMIGEKKYIMDKWLKEIYNAHLIKRQGYLDCPWSVDINRTED